MSSSLRTFFNHHYHGEGFLGNLIFIFFCGGMQVFLGVCKFFRKGAAETPKMGHRRACQDGEAACLAETYSPCSSSSASADDYSTKGYALHQRE